MAYVNTGSCKKNRIGSSLKAILHLCGQGLQNKLDGSKLSVVAGRHRQKFCCINFVVAICPNLVVTIHVRNDRRVQITITTTNILRAISCSDLCCTSRPKPISFLNTYVYPSRFSLSVSHKYTDTQTNFSFILPCAIPYLNSSPISSMSLLSLFSVNTGPFHNRIVLRPSPTFLSHICPPRPPQPPPRQTLLSECFSSLTTVIQPHHYNINVSTSKTIL